MDKVNHVLTQLALSNRPSNKNSEAIKIQCPYHGGGNERTPSCSVNLIESRAPVGHFYCFGCHTKGSWNKLADTLNLSGFKARDRVNDVFAFSFAESEPQREIKVPLIERPDQLTKWPRDRRWRTIDGAVVRKFGGVAPVERYPRDFLVGRNFIYFPVLVGEKNVGGIYARRKVTKKQKREGSPSYINVAGRWTQQFVFGYNVAKLRKNQPLWIVEGPRDAMKIYQMGGRAIALMGAYVSPKKLRLIEALDPPQVIIATDPDEAGERARKELKRGLPMLPCLDAVFPPGKDPGNFRPRSYQKMLRRLGL